MSLFGSIVKTVVNVATLPANVVIDTITAFPDACELSEQDVGDRTRRNLEKLKEEAGE